VRAACAFVALSRRITSVGSVFSKEQACLSRFIDLLNFEASVKLVAFACLLQSHLSRLLYLCCLGCAESCNPIHHFLGLLSLCVLHVEHHGTTPRELAYFLRALLADLPFAENVWNFLCRVYVAHFVIIIFCVVHGFLRVLAIPVLAFAAVFIALIGT